MPALRAFIREPYRVLFPLGALAGCSGVGHWLAYAMGIMPEYSGFLHASIQLGAYLACFILGFLWTALPRFTATPPARGWEVAALGFVISAEAWALWRQQWPVAVAAFGLLLLALAAFAALRVGQARERVTPPAEFVWILAAVIFGLAGCSVTLLVQFGHAPVVWLAWARPLWQQGFLLAIVIGVAGFLAPRLLGRLASFAPMTVEQAARQRRQRLRWHGLGIAVLAASFLLEGSGAIRAAYAARAALLTVALVLPAKLWQPPRAREEYVWLLWTSLWMVALGFWGPVAWPRFRVALLHVAFIGGFSLMIFAVATMVIYSHAGDSMALRGRVWPLRLAAAGVAVALVARLAADLWPARYTLLLGTAAAGWLAGMLVWLIGVTPRLLRMPPPGAFETAHEAAKAALRQRASAC